MKPRTVGWKFYLAFIIPGTIGGIIMFIFFPDTKGLPLEEIAAIFGDADEVAIYQRDIQVDHQDHHITERSHDVAKAEPAKSEAVEYATEAEKNV